MTNIFLIKTVAVWNAAQDASLLLKPTNLTEHNPHLNPTDQELLQLYHNSSNNKYLGILLQRYTLLLLGVCMKYLKNEEEAKDAVQQVFSKVILEIPKYPITYFKSWIYMVAKNHCLMQLRQRKITIPAEWIERELDGGEDLLLQQATWAAQTQMTNWLEEALRQLPEAQQQCVSLFYLQKMSYQQVAEHTGMTLGNIKSHIQNGKRNLRIWVSQKMKNHVG